MEIDCSEISKVVEYLCPRMISIGKEEKNARHCDNTIVIFFEIGEQVDISEDDLHSAVTQGIYKAQDVNTNIAVEIYTGIVLGDDDADKVKITVFERDKGAENMSSLEMLKFARSAQSGTVVIGGHAKCLI